MAKDLLKIIFIAIIAAGVLTAGTYFYLNKNKPPQEKFLSPQETAQKALNYINENLLQKGVTASLVDVVEENGLYKIRLKVGEQEFVTYITKNGKILFPEEGINLEEKPATTTPTEEPKKLTIGSFSVSTDTVCKENEKPAIYFFGSTTCPHCAWEHPIMEKIVKKFEGLISFHNNMDSNSDADIFKKYSTGGVPTLVLGCKYYRVGSGEGEGEELESKNLTAIICKLTGNQPSETCDSVKDLISQIVE